MVVWFQSVQPLQSQEVNTPKASLWILRPLAAVVADLQPHWPATKIQFHFIFKKNEKLKNKAVPYFNIPYSKTPKSLSFYHTRFLSTPDRHLVPHFHSQAAMERSPVLIYSQTFMENTSVFISQLVVFGTLEIQK